MPDSRSNWRRLPLQTQAFFFLILAGMFYLTWLIFEDFVIYLITGIFLAVIALPIDKFWEKFFSNRVAAGFTMFTMFLMLALPLFILGIAMYKDVSSLAASLEGKDLDSLINRTVERDTPREILGYVYPGQNATELKLSLANATAEGKMWLINSLQDLGREMVASIPEIMIAITIIPMVIYYILVDGERFVGWFRRSTPLPARQVDYLLRETRNGLNAVFMGQILTCILQGVLGGIGFVITGLPNPVLWAAVMALLALLPVVGTNIVWIPAGLYLIIDGNLWGGIFMLAWGTFVVMIFMDNVIRPKLIGRHSDIHPMFVLVGVLGGAAVFGFIGLFLGPLLVGVTLAILNVYEADYLDPEINLVEEREENVGGEPADPDTAPAS
ncbi:MAG: AI-2E family transporter [Candidatus Thermoplasmatota archaeon]